MRGGKKQLPQGLLRGAVWPETPAAWSWAAKVSASPSGQRTRLVKMKILRSPDHVESGNG